MEPWLTRAAVAKSNCEAVGAYAAACTHVEGVGGAGSGGCGPWGNVVDAQRVLPVSAWGRDLRCESPIGAHGHRLAHRLPIELHGQNINVRFCREISGCIDALIASHAVAQQRRQLGACYTTNAAMRGRWYSHRAVQSRREAHWVM